MELTKNQLQTVKQALEYAVLFSKTEHETAEFSLLLIDIEEAILRKQRAEIEQLKHEKLGCPFHYCAFHPKCIGSCRYIIPVDPTPQP